MTTDNVYVGVHTFYEQAGVHVPFKELGRYRYLVTKVTGQALTANAWSQAAAAANCISSANGQLNTGHKYAIAYAYIYSTNGVACKFEHSDWKGLRPGGMIARTISHRKGFVDFRRLGILPAFSASSPLIPWVYAEGTDTPVMWVALIDLGKAGEGAQVGVLDHNMAMKAVTDGAGLELLAVVNGDSLTVKNDRGACALEGYWITGTAPLRGQIRSTDKALQPNPVDIPPHCTLAGDYENVIRIDSRPELMPESLIDCYGES